MKTQDIIHVGSRTYFLPTEIVMIKAIENYSMIYLLDGTNILVSTTLKIIEQRLSNCKCFERVHRSFLINTNYLESINLGKIQLINNINCLISRRKFKILFNCSNAIL